MRFAIVDGVRTQVRTYSSPYVLKSVRTQVRTYSSPYVLKFVRTQVRTYATKYHRKQTAEPRSTNFSRRMHVDKVRQQILTQIVNVLDFHFQGQILESITTCCY